MAEKSRDEDETVTEDGDEANGKEKPWYPYITKTQFEKFLSRLQSKIPDEIDRDYVRAIIRTPSMIYRFLRGVEAMGLIDDEQRPTDRLRSLVDKETRKQALAEVVRDLYPTLLAKMQEADGEMADRDIVTFFRNEAGMGNVSANKMKMFFKYLLSEADDSAAAATETATAKTDDSESADDSSGDAEAKEAAPEPEPTPAPAESRRGGQSERRPQRGGSDRGERGGGSDRGERGGGNDRGERGGGNDRGERGGRGDREDRGGRSEREDRSERSERGGRGGRGGRDRSDRNDRGDREDRDAERVPSNRPLTEAQRAYLDTLKSVLRVNVDGDWDDDMIRLAFDRLERLFDRIRRG